MHVFIYSYVGAGFYLPVKHVHETTAGEGDENTCASGSHKCTGSQHCVDASNCTHDSHVSVLSNENISQHRYQSHHLKSTSTRNHKQHLVRDDQTLECSITQKDTTPMLQTVPLLAPDCSGSTHIDASNCTHDSHVSVLSNENISQPGTKGR